MRIPSSRASSGHNRLGNSTQATSLASHCGTSIRAVPSDFTPYTRQVVSGFDGMNGSVASQMSRGSVKGRCSAETMMQMSEEAYADPSKYGTNPLAPGMAAPSHESTAVPSRNRSNPLSRTLGSVNDWSQSESEVSSGYAPSSGLDGAILNTGARVSQLARPGDHLAYRPSVRSNLPGADSRSGSRRQQSAPHTVTRGEVVGLRNNHRQPFRTSSSDSPPASPNSGDDFTTRLERIPLLDEGPTLRKSAKHPWPPTGTKHRVREMAARFEKVAQVSSTSRAKHSWSSGQDRASGSGRSVSCPVEGRSTQDSSMEANRGGAGDPFSAASEDAKRDDGPSERAWERLTTALENIPPDDLAMLQEILLNQGNLSQGEGFERRSDSSEKKGDGASGRSNGVFGEK